jgi:hypothetical protein
MYYVKGIRLDNYTYTSMVYQRSSSGSTIMAFIITLGDTVGGGTINCYVADIENRNDILGVYQIGQRVAVITVPNIVLSYGSLFENNIELIPRDEKREQDGYESEVYCNRLRFKYKNFTNLMKNNRVKLQTFSGAPKIVSKLFIADMRRDGASKRQELNSATDIITLLYECVKIDRAILTYDHVDLAISSATSKSLNPLVRITLTQDIKKLLTKMLVLN